MTVTFSVAVIVVSAADVAVIVAEDELDAAASAGFWLDLAAATEGAL